MKYIFFAHYTQNEIKRHVPLFTCECPESKTEPIRAATTNFLLSSGKLKELQGLIVVSIGLANFLKSLPTSCEVLVTEFKAGCCSEVDSGNFWRYVVKVKG